jgi:penicillin-binding protein 1C
MEINLTAIWETVTTPFVTVWSKVTNRPRSRRRLRYQPIQSGFIPPGQAANSSTTTSTSGSPRTKKQLTPAEKRLRMIKVVRILAVLFFASVIVGFIGFFALFAWVAKDLPKPGQVARREGFTSKILDRNGKLLYDLYAEERRDPINIADAPLYLKQATVAVEDKDFYKHAGVDPLTPFRMVYNYVFRNGRIVGGSTLTQQLVKNALLTNERSVSRKFREFILALQIERKYTKDQILELYMNEAPYGGNSVGIGAASQIYFGKPIRDLNLVESAIIAGLPQRPTAYSPHTGKTDTDGTPLWKVRAKGVLRRMNEDGYISNEEHDKAVADLDVVQFAAPKTTILAPHFVFYVRDQLEKEFGETVVAKGGLQITTTLDIDLQQQAQEIVKAEIEKVKTADISNGAVLVMSPKTGEILSMVGSVDYNSTEIDGKFNVVVDGLRQPGSSIKPVTFLAMFRKGFTPATMLADVPTIFQRNDSEKPYEPKNYDGKFRGPVNLRNSLGSSLNITSVKSLAIVGIKDFLQLSYDMGFPTLKPTEENMRRFGLAVTLGGAEVHLIDTVTAYSAFANGGTRVDPVSILKVTDKDGRVLREFKPVQGKRVMSSEEAFLINDILSDNDARLLAFGANSLLNAGKGVAVKTGTTNDQKDNWTIGWTQDVIIGSWVGNNDNKSMKRVASGITGASPIWRNILNYALKNGYDDPEFTPPAGIEEVEVDVVSGYPKHSDFSSRKEYVIKGTLPALPDPIHSKLKLCKGQNKLATDAKVASADYEEKEFILLKENDPFSEDNKNRWQDAINAWISGQSDDKFKPPTEYCGELSDISVRVEDPQDERSYSTQDVQIKITADSGDGIEKIELWIDGGLRETINNRTYQTTVNLPTGRHTIYARAKSRTGKEATSNTVRIGTGNQDWREPSPVPTPQPSPQQPSPVPSPVIVPTPVPSPSPVIPSPSPVLPSPVPSPTPVAP